jgi:hypothetical protein
LGIRKKEVNTNRRKVGLRKKNNNTIRRKVGFKKKQKERDWMEGHAPQKK